RTPTNSVPATTAQHHSSPNGHAPVGLTVREVLAAPCLANARILAGESGLDRIVQRLNVMEVPDILPWVKPYELLLTTGYPLRDDPDALVALLGDLDDRGLAALAIKLHRYLDEVPPRVLEEADRRGFPVIEFPIDVGFDDVLNEVLSMLLNRQAALAARSEEVHRALVSVVLEGGGLDDLAAELATILRAQVFVTTPDGRVVAQAGDGAELARILGSAAFDRSGRFKVEAPPTAPAPDGDHCAVVPIVAGRVDHGRIVTFSRTPTTTADIYCLERAATVAALAITKGLAVAAVEDKYRADFLRDLLTGRSDDIASAVAHAASLGWDIDRPIVVAVAELDPGQVPSSVSGMQLRPVQERFAAAWQTVMRMRDPMAPVASFNTEVVVLHAAVPPDDLSRLISELDRQVAGDRGGGRLSFSLGISRTAADPSELPRAYEQARTAVRIGRRLQGPGARATFDQLGAYRLLALIPDSAELRGYVSDVLGELASDTNEAADLRHTLEVLLDTNGNVAETARRLHFHYNTLRYRIEKLERLVGPFTTNAALRLDLSLALRVRQMRGAP
ncbi:MAG TPA: PucR family transcriptional regulator ligand-binding domain-containing protein, partial [Micromonosporaceae bacterium]|nr:PucR family transcriptional regulator ligand-binding domain-containing protein [Micromonosporaceae bacterium]